MNCGEEKKSSLNYFHVFGSKFYNLVDREQKCKLNPKSYEDILGYYTISSVYCVFNNQTKFMMESINVIVNDIDKCQIYVNYVNTYWLISQAIVTKSSIYL